MYIQSPAWNFAARKLLFTTLVINAHLMIRWDFEFIICETTKVLKNPSLEKSLLKGNPKMVKRNLSKVVGIIHLVRKQNFPKN